MVSKSQKCVNGPLSPFSCLNLPNKKNEKSTMVEFNVFNAFFNHGSRNTYFVSAQNALVKCVG